MLSASAGYKTVVSGYSRKWSAQILDSNNTPLSCDIMGVEVHKGTRGRDYQLGTMYAPHFTGTIRGYTGALMGETLQFQLGLEVSGSTEWVTICTGTVYQITENGDDLSFTAAGVLATAGDLIVTEQGTDITDIITDIETLTGVTVSAVGAASTIGLTGTLAQSMDGLDVRTALQYLAGVFGGFVSEGADGGIVIGNVYSGTQVQVTDDEIQKLPDSSGSFDITGFEVVVTAGGVDASGTVIPDVSYTDGTVVLTSVNPYMTQTLFNSVKSYVTGLTVYAGAIEQTMGNPLIEPWDIVYNDAYSDLRGSEIVITYNGGVSCRITSELTTTEEVSTVQTGPMSAQISKIEDKLYTIQDGLNYFWVDSSGAHVTQVPKETFLASPQGGNTLIDSNGLQVRDGTTTVAKFNNTGAQVGEDEKFHVELLSNSTTFYDDEGEASVVIKNRTGAVDYGILSQSYSPPDVVTTVATQHRPSFADGTFDVQITTAKLDGSSPLSFSESFSSYTTISTSDYVCTLYSTANGAEFEITSLDASRGTSDLYITYPYLPTAPTFSIGSSSSSTGDLSFSQGDRAVASGKVSFASGLLVTASGDYSHAEGEFSTASGLNSHAEAGGTASGDYSHAESGTASGKHSHAQNNNTVAGYADQTAIGKYNDNKSGNLFEIGNGTSNSARSNAFEVANTGNVTAAGTVTVQGHASAIGAFNQGSTTTASLSTGTSYQTTGQQFTLSEGKWLINAGMRFPSNATGTRRICIRDVTNSANLGRSRQSCPALSGAQTDLSTYCIVSVGSAGNTYAVWAQQNSGSTMNNIEVYWLYMRLA